MDSDMKWYALFVETGQEERLKQLINTVYPDEDIKILIPKRKLKERRQGKTHEVVKKLFPDTFLLKQLWPSICTIDYQSFQWCIVF